MGHFQELLWDSETIRLCNVSKEEEAKCEISSMTDNEEELQCCQWMLEHTWKGD